jgi:hypothetical protein
MASRELVVGSAPPSITSSRRVVLAIAASMRAVGVVTMSPRVMLVSPWVWALV